MKPSDFSHGKTQSVAFPANLDRYGYTSIRKTLPFLKGRPWDEVALAYVSGLRPSCIRVIKHNSGMHCDARVWRVTVHLGKRGKISEIEQEVAVWLPDGVQNGWALQHALQFGIDSPQVKWHQNAGSVLIDGIDGGTWKLTDDGESVPFPT